MKERVHSIDALRGFLPYWYCFTTVLVGANPISHLRLLY